MKKTIVAIVLLAMAAATENVAAKPVDKNAAANIAAKVLKKAVVDATPEQCSEFHLYTGADGKGYVLVAADDRVRPVLAYSLDETFSTDNMPTPVANWVDGYRREIASVVAATNNPSPKVAKEWARWENGIPVSSGKGEQNWVPALMSSVWNQSGPYNTYCPYDYYITGTRTVTGCVATSMAQVMRYWQWPDVGYGSHTYSWDTYGELSANFDTTHYHWSLMPDTLTSTSGSQAIDAVATLMFHAGVAVEMMYGPSSTGGSPAYGSASGGFDFACAENALKSYFRYNPMLFSRYKDDYSEAEWQRLMHAELDAGRPVIYAAVQSRTGGHSFVIDGYDSVGFYHVNWGWGGLCNGWYTIDSLAPEHNGNVYYCFNGIAEAIMGICPLREPAASAVSVNIVSNDPSLGSVTGNGIYQPYDTVRIRVQPAEGCRFVRMASGRRNVPFDFLAVGDNYTDTAIFERITGNTVGYCHNYYIEDQPYGESGTFDWGIRIPATVRQERPLTAVQFYFLVEGDHTLKIYAGDSTLDGATPIYTKTYSLTGPEGWRTLSLDNVLTFDPDQPVWITLNFTDNDHWVAPIAGTSYSGNPDGSWYRFNRGCWNTYHPIGGYYTWLLRGVLGYRIGITEVKGHSLSCSLQGLHLAVENPDGATVRLLDIMGRQLSSSKASSSTFRLPAPGVYLLQADGHPVQRIVAIQ